MSNEANAAQNTNQAAASTQQTSGAATSTPTTAQTNKAAEGAGAQTPPAENKPNSEASKTPSEPKPSVPEKYELKLSEGSQLDANDLAKIEAFAKAKNLTNEQAQEYLVERETAVSSFAERQQKALENLNEVTWKQELMNDSEFGGADFEANGHLAMRAAETFFGKEFVDDLKSMKLNHQPKMFRGLVRIAKAMQDDKLVLGGAGPTQEKSAAEVFYGNTK